MPPPHHQTLNLENFEITMYAFIRANSYGSAAYFLAWIVLGKFILLALFLAVMLEAFENKYQVGRRPSRGSGRLATPCVLSGRPPSLTTPPPAR